MTVRMLMGSNSITLLLAGLVVSRALSLCAADERIWLEAKINDKPARLCFDSGSRELYLTRGAVERLGVKLAGPLTNEIGNQVSSRNTGEVILSLKGRKSKTAFRVLDLPAYAQADFEGMIGWSFLHHDVIKIDAVHRELTILDMVPKRTAQWARFPIITNFGTIDLQVPHGGDAEGVVCMDTGSSGGLWLSWREWDRWKQAHTNVPMTLDTVFSAADGFLIYEEAWCDEIAVGPLVLKGVPVALSGPTNERRFGARYEGTLGLAALNRLDLIIDGNSNLAYLRPNRSHPSPYEHNRLGAVFAPTRTLTDRAVARVVDGSPAYEAGVRNGDVLVRLDDLAVTRWTNSWVGRFYLPAGTKLKLHLERDEKVFDTTAILRDIVSPGAERKGAAKPR